MGIIIDVDNIIKEFLIRYNTGLFDDIKMLVFGTSVFSAILRMRITYSHITKTEEPFNYTSYRRTIGVELLNVSYIATDSLLPFFEAIDRPNNGPQHSNIVEQ